jgi:hypothetical protein
VLEDPAIIKAVHNQPVDDHAIHNHGVDLKGCINTLGLSRWVWPELVTSGGFGLKNLMFVKLRRDPICEFNDVVNDERQVLVSRWKKVCRTVCACGVEGCRKRKAELGPIGTDSLISHDKRRTEEDVEVVREKLERFQHPLESIVPGHPRWELLVRYAAEDAVAALEVLELAQSTNNPAAFPYRGTRPGFSQAVEDEVVLMERTGFRVDVDYAAAQATRAEADEASELAWLRRWYLANDLDPEHTDEDIDAIWSSPKQLTELLDSLSVPRSPVWKKGRVKPGEVKLDQVALEWVAKEVPDVGPLIKHLLQLKRIRSGKKYLVKIRDSGGWVNPICGPAGDADDRNGAVTGRLGIKGVLEAQQLPTREAADLYQIRKAVIA